MISLATMAADDVIVVSTKEAVVTIIIAGERVASPSSIKAILINHRVASVLSRLIFSNFFLYRFTIASNTVIGTVK